MTTLLFFGWLEKTFNFFWNELCQRVNLYDLTPQELLSEIELVSSFRHPDLVPEPCMDVSFFYRRSRSKLMIFSAHKSQWCPWFGRMMRRFVKKLFTFWIWLMVSLASLTARKCSISRGNVSVSMTWTPARCCYKYHVSWVHSGWLDLIFFWWVSSGKKNTARWQLLQNTIHKKIAKTSLSKLGGDLHLQPGIFHMTWRQKAPCWCFVGGFIYFPMGIHGMFESLPPRSEPGFHSGWRLSGAFLGSLFGSRCASDVCDWVYA